MSKVLCGNSVGNMQTDLHIRNKENITAWDGMEVKMKYLQLCAWLFFKSSIGGLHCADRGVTFLWLGCYLELDTV